ncbi:MAG: PAS domain S-box protein [Candidatus Bathyarchaeia archaeon]
MRSARGRAIKRRGRKGTIRESDFYRTIFEMTGTAMIIIEEDTTISMVNSEFTRLWGYAKEEVEGKSWTEFVAKEDLERMLEYHQRRRIDPESVPRSYEFRGIDKNGNVRDVRITISMIPGTKKSIASLLDITDLKRAEREARRAEEKYRVLVENLNDVIFSLDARGNISYISPAVERMLGYKAEELIGQHFSRWILQEDLPRVEASFKEVMEGGEARPIEFRAYDKGGGIHWLRGFGRPLMEDGRAIGLTGVASDITEKKRLEEELRRYVERLEALVEERTKELRALSASLAERLLRIRGQVEEILRLKDEVRRAPDISTGLDSILDAALNILGGDSGAVFLVDREWGVLRLRAFKSGAEGLAVKESYPLNEGFIELEAIRSGRMGSKVVGKDGASIMGTDVVHYAPIMLGEEIHGLLIIGGKGDEPLDEGDLFILHSFAELASTLFEVHSLRIAPRKEAGAYERPFGLEFGATYLIKDGVGRAFEIFLEAALSGIEGLCITREYPPKVRKRYGLERTPIVWLSDEMVEGERTVKSLQELSIMIDNFLEGGRKVILLDGIEYLIMQHGFESFMRFLYLNRSRVERRDSILIAPLLEGALDPRQVNLIEREMKPLPSS